MSTFRFIVQLSTPERASKCQSELLQIDSKNMHPPVVSVEGDSRRVIVLGSPIIRECIQPKVVARTLLSTLELPTFVRGLDGAFLILVHDLARNELIVINDRFASIPFYYRLSDNGVFIGSITYTDIYREIQTEPGFRLAEESFFEFIHFQRLFGTKTYDPYTKYLDSASLLRVSGNAQILSTEKYWHPNFTKDERRSRREFGYDLAEALKRSVRMRTSDSVRYGLLLSGGMDSRLVLAATETPVTCFTFGDFRNNEFKIASQIASTRGLPHKFISRHPEHYVKILGDAVTIGSGMNVFDHGHALHFDKAISDVVDVVIHGHGIDPFFQGTYLPVNTVNFLGRPTHFQRLKSVAGQIASEYIRSIKYRLKSIPTVEIVRPEHRARMNESLYASIEAILQEGRAYSDDQYDLWEYLYNHNLSRAFSNLNLLGIKTYSEERSVSYDNELFDLYLRMPVRHRLTAHAHRHALGRLDARLNKLPNANTNLPGNWGPYQSTLMSFGHKVFRKLGLRHFATESPSRKDRSWADRDEIFRELPPLSAIARRLTDSERLASIKFLDMTQIGRYVDAHMNRQGNYGALLFTLITIDEFLNQPPKGEQ